MHRQQRQTKINKMTIWDDKMTLETATKLMKSVDGMMYPDTQHNRTMIAKVSHSILTNLRKKRLEN